jgi:hypothetical protein
MKENRDGTGQHIWLRYATQYSKNGRTHTIEMGIPVPLGASAETREKLLREAEIGMSQLVQHVEERVFQALEGVQSGDTATDQWATIPLPQISPSSSAPNVVSKGSPSLAASTSSTAQSKPAVPDQPPPVQTHPVNKPASLPAPQTTIQTPNLSRTPSRTAPPAAQAVNVPPTRDSVGASMPSSLSPTSASGNLTIPEFISYVGKNLHLTPKQAMELLRVKTLTGINLRESLEKLKQIVAQNTQAGTSVPPGASVPQQQASTVREARPATSTPFSHNTPSQSTPSVRQNATIDELPTRSPGDSLEDSEQVLASNAVEMRVAPPVQPARGFDEEEELEDLDDGDSSSIVPEISPEQLNRARDRISALRQMQGATVTSEPRLRALRNTADDDVSNAQLQELVAGVWHIQSLQKLKKDQVEALISWAKEDDFLQEVKAALVVLEEEHYARGNR